MNPLTLMVKGSEHNAAKEAAKRGIPFVFKSYNKEWNATIGETTQEHLDKVAVWFIEPHTVFHGQGYPAGTLLHYSHKTV